MGSSESTEAENEEISVPPKRGSLLSGGSRKEKETAKKEEDLEASPEIPPPETITRPPSDPLDEPPPRKDPPPFTFAACCAEFVAMFLFVFICAGSATGVATTSGWVQQVSLTFGIAITVLAYSIGHISGGQINCAVTFGLLLQGELGVAQAIANFVMQMLGSIAGAACLAAVKDGTGNNDLTNTLGTNLVDADIGYGGAVLGEILMTFLLMFVVLQTAVNPKSAGNRSQAPIAIGFAVYIAHSFLIPIDGCSINPTRSFGPLVVATIRHTVEDNEDLVTRMWEDHWVFWVGPFAGSALAVAIYRAFEKLPKFNFNGVDVAACAAEFLAMLLFVLICAGSATGVAGTDGWVQQVSLTFGAAITVLAYTFGHISGAQINCAVTFGLMVARKLPLLQGLANFGSQMAGSLAGAALLAAIKDGTGNTDRTGALGSNTVNPNVSAFGALLGEILGTFLLMFVVFQTAVSPKTEGNRSMAPIAIGFAVYLAHSFLIPVDGCSINPTRSWGPPVVASIRHSDNDSLIEQLWEDHWIFWIGPLLGAGCAHISFVNLNMLMFLAQPDKPDRTAKE